MGQLTNLYVSQSYQGLLKLADSTTGVTSTLQSVQDGLGNNIPIKVSNTTVQITGSLIGTASYATQALSASWAPDSTDTGSLVTTASFNAFTSSIDGRVDALEVETGSLQLQINQKLNTSSFNSYTSSNDSKVDSLIAATGSYVTETESGSFLITGSVNGNTLTFTKGNGSQFNLQIDTGSNSNRNGLITTGSAGGNQSITGSLNIGGTISATSASFTYVTTIYETASVIYSTGSNQFGDASNDTQTLWGRVAIPTGPVSVTGSVTATNFTGSLQGTASYASNALSASYANNATSSSYSNNSTSASFAQTSISSSQATNANTASYVLQAVSASYATNALSSSFSQNTISGSFSNFAVSSSFSQFAISASQAQNAVTASFLTGTIASASYAVNADTASIARDVIVVGKCDNAGGLTRGTVVRITGANGDNPLFDSASWIDETNSANVLGMLSEDVLYNGFANVVVLGKVLGLNTNAYTPSTNLYLSSSGQFTSTVPTAPSQSVRLGQVLRQNVNNGSIYFRADNGYELGELHNVIDTANTTGELLSFVSGSYGLWVNKTSDQLGLATTSSVNQKLDTGSFNTYTASMDARTGSYATTGSNRFNGNQIVSGSVEITGSLNLSGSIYMKQQSNTGLDYISSSTSGNANFLIGANGSFSTNSGSFVITGSNNFVTAQFPRTVGYINYINGHGNIMLGSAGVLLSTSSIATSVSANIGGGSMTIQFGTSSLASPVIGNNYVQASPTFTSPSGSINAINNMFIGSLAYRATGSTHNTLSTMTNNIINSTPVFNAVSSSIAMTYNTFGGGTHTINNNYTSSNASGNQLAVNRNAFFGNSHTINISGSNDASTNFTAFNDNLLAGASHIVNRSAVGTTSGSLTSTAMLGANLTVSASNRAGGNDVGSVFLGRNNDTSQGLSESTTTVLAVGTGTSTAAKRTSLHVSSSGLFQIRDSVIISGSMTVSGSATITGSVQGNVLPLTVTSNTASLNLNNGNFFELALTGSQDIRIEPSNIKPGQTVNIKLNTTGSGTVSFPTSVKQVSGSSYTPTTAVSTDIITMVSFDSTNLYLANLKNLV